MRRICALPSRSGSPTSICTSRRPGRSMASSSRSRRLVMAMSRMLLSACTPSILVSSWFTMESPTCWPPPAAAAAALLPRCLQTASISSKMMTCSGEAAPSCAKSRSASAKRRRTFCSLSPTNLESTSGPFTTLGGTEDGDSSAPRRRATSVLPVPGGPCNSMPRTCARPREADTSGPTTRDASARRKICATASSSPPMPSSASASALKPSRGSSAGGAAAGEDDGGGDGGADGAAATATAGPPPAAPAPPPPPPPRPGVTRCRRSAAAPPSASAAFSGACSTYGGGAATAAAVVPRAAVAAGEPPPLGASLLRLS
mmetsp:Transcript_2613/g.9476  ORF Transcript_2613/g.9476 Transcript_2613/m.9476 type:complete len:316 (-) Transcript_2613:174-1121(-)